MAVEPKQLDKNLLLKHYSNKLVQDELIRCSADKEVVGSYGGKGYAKRPDILRYPGDIVELVKQGITSFHSSEERWTNPLQLDPLLKRKDLDDLRSGWDLILDIDCNFLEYSKIAADLLVQALKYQGIDSISCKFSGNHGFHISVPFEAFPKEINGKETRRMFPDAPRVIAAYLKGMIKQHLANKILELDAIDLVIKKSGKRFEELNPDGEFDPYTVLELDTVLISSRHLCRMSYSINEKSGWVSIPINPGKALEFNVDDAKLENLDYDCEEFIKYKFLDRDNVVAGEAKQLLVQAYDYNVKLDELRKEKYGGSDKKFDIPEDAIPADLFPPCVKKILAGVQDGRKRCLFLLINFLRSCGWSYEQVEDLLRKWNKKNDEELREVYLIGQLRYHKQHKKNVLPPNCANGMYYKDILVCNPDSLCSKIKNPVNYAKRKAFAANYNNKKNDGKRGPLTEEEKAKRQKTREERKRFREEVKLKKERGEL